MPQFTPRLGHGVALSYVMNANEAEDPPPKRSVRILVPTDFSRLANVAVDSVLSLVRELPDVKVTLVHVVEPWPNPHVVEPEVPHQRRHAEQLMEELLLRVGPHPRLDSRILLGDPARVICGLAQAEEFRLIALSSHGHTGLARIFVGSVTEQIVQDAACPVLVVKPRRDPSGEFIPEPVNLRLERILVGYDHREGSRRALCVAGVIAKRAGASIALVHAVEPAPTGLAPSPAQLASCEESKARLAPVLDWLGKVAADHATSASSWEVKAAMGHPWDVIIDEAKARSTDLIVVGPHEHSRWGHCFVGSTAQRVVRLAPCSVLAVK